MGTDDGPPLKAPNRNHPHSHLTDTPMHPHHTHQQPLCRSVGRTVWTLRALDIRTAGALQPTYPHQPHQHQSHPHALHCLRRRHATAKRAVKVTVAITRATPVTRRRPPRRHLHSHMMGILARQGAHHRPLERRRSIPTHLRGSGGLHSAANHYHPLEDELGYIPVRTSNRTTHLHHTPSYPPHSQATVPRTSQHSHPLRTHRHTNHLNRTPPRGSNIWKGYC